MYVKTDGPGKTSNYSLYKAETRGFHSYFHKTNNKTTKLRTSEKPEMKNRAYIAVVHTLARYSMDTMSFMPCPHP